VSIAQEAGGSPPSNVTKGSSRGRKGAAYEHRVVFWLGILVTTVGVGLQLPMFYMARERHYRLAGMPVTTEMAVGMCLLLVGVGLTAYGLVPRRPRNRLELYNVKVGALDSAPVRRSHIALLLVSGGRHHY